MNRDASRAAQSFLVEPVARTGRWGGSLAHGGSRGSHSCQRNSSTPVRYDLLSTTSETFDRNIGDPLDRILGSGGFDAARDIEDITVNRWPTHGYPYEYAYVGEPEWTETDEPCILGRKPFGRMTVANSDAGGGVTSIALSTRLTERSGSFGSTRRQKQSGEIPLKLIYSTDDRVEAHMLVHALKEQGIEASVQGENSQLGQLPVAVVIANAASEEKARAIIAEILGETRRSPPLPPKSAQFFSKTAFVTGVIVGVLLGVAGSKWVPSSSVPLNRPASYDSDGDGKDDYWPEYSENRLVKDSVDRNLDGKPDEWNYYGNGTITRSEQDRNHDGKPDAWLKFNVQGVLSGMESDGDFDGKADEWETYEQGERRGYQSDNDRDGRIDEWGTYEGGGIKERNWSFVNDTVADKRAIYSNGRKTTELYDRNRDGEFDEEISLDEFERVFATTKPR